MKKFLSLVLALTMTMSLVTISAGAKEFKDDKSITYGEAVAVISEIGVVDGYADGDFKPQGNLSRGAAAKIICNLILGPTRAAELHADTAPFKDVPVSNEFSGYIAYCAKEDIISGYGNGTFRPAGTLTGYAFMKMLLGALGYDAAYEKYEGPNWSINVAKQALGIGLNKNLAEKFNGVDFVTREEAALYAFNTLQATMVDYENKITASVNGADVTISNTTAHPVTWSEGRNNDGNIKSDKFVQFAEEYFEKLVRKDDNDKFMAPAYTWMYDKTEIGTYERTDLLVEKYTSEFTGKAAYDLLKAGVIKDNDLEYYVDGAKPAANETIAKKDMVRSNEDALGATGNGVLTKVYLDTDKDLITIVSVNTWLAEATGDYSKSKEYAPVKVYTGKDQTASYNVDVEDVADVMDVKKDNFYQVNISYKENNKGEVVFIAPAQVLENATVTKYSADNKGNGTGAVNSLTTGGEKYDANKKAFYDKDVLHQYDDNLLTDNTYNVYLDQNGYFIGVSLYEGVKNYVFVTGYDRVKSNLSVKTAEAAGIFLDGTMKNIKVNVKDTNKNINDVKASEPTKAYFTPWDNGQSGNDGYYNLNRWYTYTVDKDGVYTLKPAVRMAAHNYTNDVTLNTSNLRVKDNVKYSANGNVYAEDATVFLTVDLDEVDTTSNIKKAITDVNGIYTGVQNVDIEVDAGTAMEEAEVYAVYDSEYFIIGAVVVGEGKGNNANIAYVIDGAKSEEKKGDTYYWEFEAVINGEVKTLTAKSKYTDTIRALRGDADGLVELRFDGDYVVNVKDVKDVYGNSNFTNPKSKEAKEFDAYYVTEGDELNLQGRTLYVKAGRNDNGLALAKDAKAVVIQNENKKTDVKTAFTSVDAAISHLADANTNVKGLQYSGKIIAALDSTGAATWVVFVSSTPLVTGNNDNSNIVPPVVNGTGEGASWNNGTKEVELRYYKNQLSNEQIKNEIGKLFGVPVKSMNVFMGTVLLTDGTTVPVNFAQKEIVAITVDGKNVGYVDVGTNNVPVNGLTKNGHYTTDKTTAVLTAGVLNADASGKVTTAITAASQTDIALYTVYKVVLSGGVTAALKDGTAVATTNHVRPGAVVVLSSAADSKKTHQFAVNGNPYGEAKPDNGVDAVTVDYTVNEDITVNVTKAQMVEVKVDGTSQGFFDQATGKVTFKGFPSKTEFVVEKTTTSVIAAVSSNVTESVDGFTYEVQAGDAENGVINLVSVAGHYAKIVTGTATVKLADGGLETVNNNNYVKVGSNLKIDGTTAASQKLYADVDGVETAISAASQGDGSTAPAVASWAVPAGAKVVTISQKA